MLVSVAMKNFIAPVYSLKIFPLVFLVWVFTVAIIHTSEQLKLYCNESFEV